MRFWETVETNLRAGRVRLIFAADEIPPELRRIIEFLDERMTPTEVLGIEIRQYVGTNGHTLVPTVIRSSRKSTPIVTPPRHWDAGSFMEVLLERQGTEVVAVARHLLEWAAKNGITLLFGKGQIDGSCFLGIMHHDVAYFPAAMWTSGTIQLQCQTLQQRGTPLKLVEALLADLKKIHGVTYPADPANRFPSFGMNLLKEPHAIAQFADALASFLMQVRTLPKASVLSTNHVGV